MRLTNLGIRNVRADLIEAADAFGSTPLQMLFDVQLPLAMRTIMAGSSRRSFTDEDRACAGSTTTDFTLDVLNEGLLVQVDLTISGTSPDIDFSIYRDASRTVLVKTWANVTATTTFRELLDWLNEETPQDGLAYCSVLNNTANEATVTTTLTIKEV